MGQLGDLLDDLGKTAEHIHDLFTSVNSLIPREVIVPNLYRIMADTLIREINARYPGQYEINMDIEIGNKYDFYDVTIRRK